MMDLRKTLIELLLTEPWTIQARGNSKRLAAAGRVADHLIANGVVAREKGEWEPVLDERGNQREEEIFASVWRCPVCGEEEFYGNFCPNCGADMRRRENDG